MELINDVIVMEHAGWIIRPIKLIRRPTSVKPEFQTQEPIDKPSWCGCPPRIPMLGRSKIPQMSWEQNSQQAPGWIERPYLKK